MAEDHEAKNHFEQCFSNALIDLPTIHAKLHKQGTNFGLRVTWHRSGYGPTYQGAFETPFHPISFLPHSQSNVPLRLRALASLR